ncbi:hypothetical protein [Paenibacillus swuensis]|uniref:hypothetical protein n=1 Tax=Paenibacillus swuensis TaxID=1178515 RepID=UPI0008382F44|nr:hypothetical protein [Paenibacillus swuensis]
MKIRSATLGLFLVSLVITISFLTGCGQNKSADTSAPPDNNAVSEGSSPINGAALTPAEAQETIGEQTTKVIEAIRDQDWKAIAAFVHPETGVRFSPYAHIDTAKDVVLKPDQLEKQFKDPAKLTWGTHDGSGEPIMLSFAQYAEKFIYPHDYAQAETTGYNQVIGKGNTLDNSREPGIYADAIMVEYHFNGFDPKVDGMDWGSLRLFYQQREGVWYLTGVVHDQWTI